MAAIAAGLKSMRHRWFGSAHLSCLSRAPRKLLIASLQYTPALSARISDVLRIRILPCSQVPSRLGACRRRIFYDFVILGVGRLASGISVTINFLLELYLFLVSVLHPLFVGDLTHLRQRHLQSEARPVNVNIG